MSDLNELVPPLKLCREVSAQHPELFSDSALVWMHRTALDGISEEPFLVTNRLHAEHYKREMYPAPTLAELLEMLPGNCPWIEKHEMETPVEYVVHSSRFTGSAHCDHGSERDANPATAALRLLMRVKGVGK